MAREKLIWAIDCDDVIVATGQVLIDAYNERYGTSMGLEALYNDNNNEAWGVESRSEATVRMNNLLRDGVSSDLAPTQETIDALKQLASLDELHVVTGRQSFMESATRRMIDTYLPDVFRSIEHTNYHTEEGSNVLVRTKGEVCAVIGAHALIDDHVAHGISVIESGVQEVIIWGDYPWNRHQQLGKGMVRCVAWEEVFRERERILANRT